MDMEIDEIKERDDPEIPRRGQFDSRNEPATETEQPPQLLIKTSNETQRKTHAAENKLNWRDNFPSHTTIIVRDKIHKMEIEPQTTSAASEPSIVPYANKLFPQPPFDPSQPSKTLQTNEHRPETTEQPSQGATPVTSNKIAENWSRERPPDEANPQNPSQLSKTPAISIPKPPAPLEIRRRPIPRRRTYGPKAKQAASEKCDPRVGNKYQAFEKSPIQEDADDEEKRKTGGMQLWDPSRLSEKEVDKYLQRVQQFIPYPFMQGATIFERTGDTHFSEERALFLLHVCDYDVNHVYEVLKEKCGIKRYGSSSDDENENSSDDEDGDGVEMEDTEEKEKRKRRF